MVKRTQTIRRQIADELSVNLSVFDDFVKLALKELSNLLKELMKL